MQARRLQVQLERQLEQDKRRLCGTYPGGPEGYRYIPARCVRIPTPEETRDHQRRRRRNNQGEDEVVSEGLGRFSRNELRLLRRQQVPLVNRINELHERVLALRQRNEQFIELQPTMATAVQARMNEQALNDLPIFILHCVEKMLSIHSMQEYVNINERYRHIAESLHVVDGNQFREDDMAEYVVMKLCLKRLEDKGILTHPQGHPDH